MQELGQRRFIDGVHGMRQKGRLGFLPYRKNRVYPPELKLKAVLEYLSGVGSLEEISKKYKLRNDRQLEQLDKGV